jgi:hypothetical protein
MNAIDSNDVVSLAQLLQRSQGRSLPPLSQAQPGQQKVQDTYIPIQGGALNGQTLMTVGTPNHTYKNLAFAGHTDWTHVNPRLLQIVDAQAKKLGKTATIISGYRSNHYSDQVGGFGGDPHTKGIAVDAYIDGHPIGDVIPPDVWAKLGVTSGNTPNFYKGKPDPEHLQITHVVLKGGKG